MSAEDAYNMRSKAASSIEIHQCTLLPLPGDAPARDHASLVLHDSQVYLFGGRDASGKASSTIWRLDISSLDSKWQAVHSTGTVPAARWGHSAFVWGEQMWVYGGTSSSGKPLDDLHRFDFTSASWVAVEQNGCIPDRQSRSPPQRSFQRAVAHGATLLAFGTEQQDENIDPASAEAACSAALTLHSMDLCTCTWRWLATNGGPGFTHMEALIVADHQLLAVGWAPQQPQADKDDIHMQVSYLNLMHSGSGPATWAQLQSKGVVPTARSGCAVALCPSDHGNLLLLHGGMLCSPTVQGLLTAEAYCLDLATGQWSVVQPRVERSFGMPTVGTARINHTAVAVPDAASMLLLGGTGSLNAYASCTVVECLQLVSGQQEMGPRSAGGRHGHLRALLPPGGGQAQGGVGLRMTGQGLSVQHDFRPFVFNELMSDVTLVTHDSSIPAHRLILAACPKFLSMMNQDATYTKPVERKWKVHVLDLYPDVLRLILRYLYGCLEAITADEAPLLFSASSRYGLPALRRECVKVLISSLSLETTPTFALLAHEHSCSDLMQACVGYAAASPERLSQVLGSPSYLHLTEACPRVGQAFVHAAMQQLLAK